jgi:hypothetical protein
MLRKPIRIEKVSNLPKVSLCSYPLSPLKFNKIAPQGCLKNLFFPAKMKAQDSVNRQKIVSLKKNDIGTTANMQRN